MPVLSITGSVGTLAHKSRDEPPEEQTCQCSCRDPPIHAHMLTMAAIRITVLATVLALTALPRTTLAQQPSAAELREGDDQKYAEAYLVAKRCQNVPRNGARWACQDPDLAFPTVKCLKKDLVTCGLVRSSDPLFWSFGAHLNEIIDFTRQAPQKWYVSYDAILGVEWVDAVMSNPKFQGLHDSPRDNVFAARLGQAFASVCRGQAYLIVASRPGWGGGALFQKRYSNLRDYGVGGPYKPGALQYSFKAKTSNAGYKRYNVWRDFEFPALQRNGRVANLTTVAADEGYKPVVDWRKGDAPSLKLVDADTLPVPPADDYWKG